MQPWFFSVLLLVAANVYPSHADPNSCVEACKCKWVSGKHTADCTSQNLTELPAGLSPEIQRLNFNDNQIAQLGDRAFANIQLLNLQKLSMRNCGLNDLNAEAFHGMLLLVDIDLTSNKLSQLHPGTFDQTERLRVLLLNRNRLQRLDDGLFHDLAYLQVVELSDNQLVQIGRSTFRNLPALASLTLDGNNLTSLEVASFEGLTKLGNLELGGNPWNCDCKLRPFRDWSLQRGLVANGMRMCTRPQRLVGRAWDEVRPDEMVCGKPTSTPRIEVLGNDEDGEMILKINGSGPIIILPAGKSGRIRLEWENV